MTTPKTPAERVQFGLDYLRDWAASPFTEDDVEADLLDAIEAIESLVPQQPQPINAEEVAALALKALSDPTGWVGHQMAVALNWSCPSCREDVGWEKSTWVEEVDYQTVITVECGHCGGQSRFDKEGNDLD